MYLYTLLYIIRNNIILHSHSDSVRSRGGYLYWNKLIIPIPIPTNEKGGLLVGIEIKHVLNFSCENRVGIGNIAGAAEAFVAFASGES
jgi:hypothetical protein